MITIDVDSHHDAFTSDRYPKQLCVYFLFYNGEIRYIGKTKNLQQRMMTHHTSITKYFDRVGYVPCETINELSILESKMISKYNPPDNGDDPIPLKTIDEVFK